MLHVFSLCLKNSRDSGGRHFVLNPSVQLLVSDVSLKQNIPSYLQAREFKMAVPKASGYRPRCFFDVEINGSPGRKNVDLFAEV